MKLQFLYQLRLIPRLLQEENWTKHDNEIVNEHFLLLTELERENKVILAGRTLNTDETSFGVVILEVDSEDEAVKIMNSDPAVKNRIMTATLFPFRVALLRENRE